MESDSFEEQKSWTLNSGTNAERDADSKTIHAEHSAKHPLWTPTDWYVQNGIERTRAEWVPRPKRYADLAATSFILPIDIIILIFSYCSFRERSKGSMINYAFYQAYYTYVCNKPFAEIILSGDYLNLARRLAAEPISICARLSRSDAFSQLCVHGGPTFAVYIGLGCDHEIENYHQERRTRKRNAPGSTRETSDSFGCIQYPHHWPIDTTRDAGVTTHIDDSGQFRGFGDGVRLFEQEHGEIDPQGSLRRRQRLPILTLICKYGLQGMKPKDFPPDIPILDILLRNHHYDDANQVPYDDLIQASVRRCLHEFHSRCVSSTPINHCLHDSHEHISAEIPQIVCDLHDIAEIGPEQLRELIGIAIRQNNQSDLQWLRARYPAIFIKASCMQSMAYPFDAEDGLCVLKQIMHCVDNIEWLLERDSPLDAFFVDVYMRRNRIARDDFDDIDDYLMPHDDPGAYYTDATDRARQDPNPYWNNIVSIDVPEDDVPSPNGRGLLTRWNIGMHPGPRPPITDWALYPDSVHHMRGTDP